MSLFDLSALGFPTFSPDPSAAEAAKDSDRIAAWLKAMMPRAIFERLPAAIEAITAKNRDSRLVQIMEWWNKLHADGLVGYSVRMKPPSKEILDAWEKFKKHRTAQECLENLDLVRSEIEKSPLCCEGWFRLEKLLTGATNGSTPIVRVLMDGGYRGTGNGFQTRRSDRRGNEKDFASPDDAPVDEWYRSITSGLDAKSA